MKPVGRALDLVVSAIAVVATVYAVIHRPWVRVNDLLPAGRRFVLLGLAVMVVVVVGLHAIRARRGWTRIAPRFVLYGLTLLLVMVALSRLRVERRAAAGDPVMTWPPVAAHSRANALSDLTPTQRAAWGAHIAAHRLTDSLVGDGPLSLPPAWPFPEDVAIAVRRLDSTRAEIWARSGDGTAHCIPIPSLPVPGDSARQARECEEPTTAPAGLEFARPLRAETPPSTLMESPPIGQWLQYRADAGKSAIVPDGGQSDPPVGWRAQIDGPVRSSASIVGNIVLLGTHHTGAFEARDLASGRRLWSVRLPNWVHQDGVSEGRIVVVGFGDNSFSMAGRAPSGVAAYELRTGRHLWTHFAETSVMNSPIIRDSVVVYASAAGMLRKLNLVTGALLDERQLPGGVIMAPMAATGDTLAVSLDINGACAVLMSTFEPIWCRTLPGYIKVGHAGPTVNEGVMFVSGLVLLRGTSLAEYMALDRGAQWRLLATAFRDNPEVAGQAVLALDLATGRLLWRSRLYQFTRDVLGHTSGTAAVADSVGVVIVPESDSLVGFSTRSGKTRWIVSAHKARGATLLVGSHVILTGQDGVIEVRDRLTGAVTCALRRSTGFDRGGPVLGGGLFVMADLRGGVEAIPSADLLNCAAPSAAVGSARAPTGAPARVQPQD
jgi:outer membrane protein assembly factor BamB